MFNMNEFCLLAICRKRRQITKEQRRIKEKVYYFELTVVVIKILITIPENLARRRPWQKTSDVLN